jgi:hypothetical protein
MTIAPAVGPATVAEPAATGQSLRMPAAEAPTQRAETVLHQLRGSPTGLMQEEVPAAGADHPERGADPPGPAVAHLGPQFRKAVLILLAVTAVVSLATESGLRRRRPPSSDPQKARWKSVFSSTPQRLQTCSWCNFNWRLSGPT